MLPLIGLWRIVEPDDMHVRIVGDSEGQGHLLPNLSQPKYGCTLMLHPILGRGSSWVQVSAPRHRHFVLGNAVRRAARKNTSN